MAIIRCATQTNTTSKALTSAVVVDGRDYTLKSIKRVLAAADIGDGAGQIQNASGCLIAQFVGANVKDVVNFSVYRPEEADEVIWTQLLDGYYTDSKLLSVSWAVKDNGLYLREFFNKLLKAGDIIQFLVVVGNQDPFVLPQPNP